MTKFDWDDWIENKLSLDARLTKSSMTDEDHRLKAIWDCAFPNGLKYREWSQLIHLMYVIDGEEHPMSFRAVAHHVGILLNVYYVDLLNAVYGTQSITPNPEVLAWLQQRLQECGYYQWLTEEPPQIDATTLDDLHVLIRSARPCKRLTLKRLPLTPLLQSDDQLTINTFIRGLVSVSSSWKNIHWREERIHILWDEMIHVMQYNANLTEKLMSDQMAHTFVSAITRLLSDHERNTRQFTNHRANGIWLPITQSRWEYWLVMINSTDIGVFGIEED